MSATSASFTEYLGSDVTLEMVYIPAGNFIMGSPENKARFWPQECPQHTVKVPAFYMGMYPVTQKQWRVVAEMDKVSRELYPHGSPFKGDNLPFDTMSWLEAVEFCDRLSLYTNRQYRLPTEAEWEYACRAGTSTPFYFGKTISPEQANYDSNLTYGKGGEGLHTTPVGSFPANDFGLYDMHGNVYEWCQDCWHSTYQGAPNDGSAWLANGHIRNYRVLRGGAWGSYFEHCRAAYRLPFMFDERKEWMGLRVACSIIADH